jgi:hypothetical protein
MKDKKVKFYIRVIIVSIPITFYLVSFDKNISNQFHSLDKVGVIDTAVIVRDFYGAKRRLYYEYEFVVNDEKFNGFLQYSPSHGSLNIGDSVLVKYLPDNPDDINKLVEKNDYRVVKVRRNKNR